MQNELKWSNLFSISEGEVMKAVHDAPDLNLPTFVV